MSAYGGKSVWYPETCDLYTPVYSSVELEVAPRACSAHRPPASLGYYGWDGEMRDGDPEMRPIGGHLPS